MLQDMPLLMEGYDELIALHVEILVRDLGRAMSHYENVPGVAFGDVVTFHDNRMAYFPLANGQDGASTALVQGGVDVPNHDDAVIHFAILGIDGIFKRAIAQGSELFFLNGPSEMVFSSPRFPAAKVIALRCNQPDRRLFSRSTTHEDAHQDMLHRFAD